MNLLRSLFTLFRRKPKDINTLQAEGNVVELVANLDNPTHTKLVNHVWSPSDELADAILGFADKAIDVLIVSASESEDHAKTAWRTHHPAAGGYFNNWRSRIELLGRTDDPRAIKPILNAFTLALEVGHVPKKEMISVASFLERSAERVRLQNDPAHIRDVGRNMQSEFAVRLLGESARAALITLGNQVVRPIREMLPSSSSPVKFGLAAVLGGIGGEDARSALETLRNDPDADVRDQAQRSLMEIKSSGPSV